MVRFNSGHLALRRADLAAAESHYAAAEALYRQVGDSLGIANTLIARGDLEKLRNDDQAALVCYQEASEIYERIEENMGLSNVLVEVGELDIKGGRSDDAVAGLRTALPLALQCENRYAINKCVELLKKLDIDPESLLK